MISLFIDTALSYIRIALLKDDVLLDFIDEKCDKNMSSLFDVRVRNLFSRNNLSLHDVDKIYTVTGPGSFTGIRVGMTFSKVLAFSLNKKITPISELQVLASSKNVSGVVAPLIDARRGYVYAGIYDNDLNNIAEDKYVLLDEFLSNNSVSYISYDSFEHISTVVPDIDFEKLIIKNENMEQVDHHVLIPNYLKLTEAEENLKKRELNDN